MCFKKSGALFFIMGISLYGYSQKIIAHSQQQWVQYYNQTKIARRWYYGIDGGFRWKEREKFQYIARTGILYQLTNKVRIGGGITTTGNYQLNTLAKTEIRPYQEVFASLSDSKVSIVSRFRLEERFFTNQLVDPHSHTFNYRFRYQLAFNIPLLKLSKEDDSKKLLLSISDELFLNAGKEMTYSVLDRNRLVIGPAWQISKSLTVAINYLYQFGQKNAPAEYDVDDVIWITLKHNMNLVKSKTE